MQIPGKVFVVTGGGNGIGREIVLNLLRRGARVAAVDRSEAGLAETVRLAGHTAERLSTHLMSVADEAAVAELPDAVIAAHGAVDGLLNVAGIIQRFVPVNELTRADIEKVMNVNFWGVVTTVKAFLPVLLTRPQAAILNVSSMGGFLPVPGQTAYGASKAAVKLFSEGLHAELRNTPVAVTVVFPGAVATDISAHSGASLPAATPAAAGPGKRRGAGGMIRPIPPAEAAAHIVDAMERGRYHAHVGRDSFVLDKLARIYPRRAMQLIASAMAGVGR